jgi:hypothetical protein
MANGLPWTTRTFNPFLREHAGEILIIMDQPPTNPPHQNDASNRTKGEPKRYVAEFCANNIEGEEGPCYGGELFLYRDGEEYGFGVNSYAFVYEDCKRSTYLKSNCPSGRLKDLMAKGWSISPLNKTKTSDIPGNNVDYHGIVDNWAIHSKQLEDPRRRGIYGDD